MAVDANHCALLAADDGAFLLAVLLVVDSDVNAVVEYAVLLVAGDVKGQLAEVYVY